MAHNIKFFGGKPLLKTPPICIALIKNMSEDTKLVLTRTIPHKYAQLSTSQAFS